MSFTPRWCERRAGELLAGMEPATDSSKASRRTNSPRAPRQRGSRPSVYRSRQNQWRLTAAERKRILLDHIYGVDVDPQAVEVTKLSLLLKVLEGENTESLERQLRLFRQRALPDLASNITVEGRRAAELR